MADLTTSGPSNAEVGEAGRVMRLQERDERPCIFRYITAVVRTWGMLTAIAIWACTVALLKDYRKYVYTPWYLLFLSVVFSFFEIVWILNKLACCNDDGGCCCKCWKAILWVDDWKKFILYSLISIPCFIKGIAIHLAVISGLLVIATAIFYLLKTIKRSECIEKKRKVYQYVETVSPTANLVEHEVQSGTDQPVNYGASGETSPIQPRTEAVSMPGKVRPAVTPATQTEPEPAPQPSTESDATTKVKHPSTESDATTKVKQPSTETDATTKVKQEQQN